MLVAPFVDTSGTTALLPRVRETLDAIIEMVVSDQYSGMRTHWLGQGKGVVHLLSDMVDDDD